MAAPADRIVLTDFTSAPMRAFHAAWVAFLLSFVGWFALAPLTPLIRDELHLSRGQIGAAAVASVATTILARLVAGALCDRFGPRRVHATLLLVTALPLLATPLCRGPLSFIVLRALAGIGGASFVATQFHVSVMFDRRCVGTANAMTAGWGNLGGGLAQLVMPLLVAALTAAGVALPWAWRLAPVGIGVVLVACAVGYARWTQDLPGGDWRRLRAARGEAGSFAAVARDARVWSLFVMYAACFGVEIAIDNAAALYFRDRYALGLTAAGAVASIFGGMNLFARALGGWLGDRAGRRGGLTARFRWLGLVLAVEGVALFAFARAASLPLAIALFALVGLFVAMGAGATYAVIPCLDGDGSQKLGRIAGVVGAGGNVGAVAASLLLGAAGSMSTALWILGACVLGAASLGAVAVRDRQRAATGAVDPAVS